MAEYTYKGYKANVYEKRLRNEWLTFVPEKPLFKVWLASDFCSYESKQCDESEAKTIRAMYIKFFCNAVDKHLNYFK